MRDRNEQAVVLLTAREVADILKLKSVRSVYKLAARHRWGFQRTLGHRCVRYERGGLLRWLRRRSNRNRREESVGNLTSSTVS